MKRNENAKGKRKTEGNLIKNGKTNFKRAEKQRKKGSLNNNIKKENEGELNGRETKNNQGMYRKKDSKS